MTGKLLAIALLAGAVVAGCKPEVIPAPAPVPAATVPQSGQNTAIPPVKPGAPALDQEQADQIAREQGAV